MTIKTKLTANACIMIIVVSAVAVTSFIGMRSIKGRLSYLTEKSTPFQMRTVEFQRSLQGATADLIKVVASATAQEFAAAKSEAEQSLRDVRTAQEVLENLSGEKLQASDELNGIAAELFSTMTAKLTSERESAEASAMISRQARETTARLKELDRKVKNLQQSSSAAYASATDETDKIAQRLRSIETLKASLKEVQYLIVDLQRVQNKKQIQEKYAVAMKKVMQNGNVRQNKQIGSEVAALNARVEELIKAQVEGGDQKRVDALAGHVGEALATVSETIEDEADKANQMSTVVAAKLKGNFSDSNIAVGVLSSNSDLVSLGVSVEGLSSRLFLAGSEKELDGIAAEINQQYGKIAAAEKAVAASLRKVKASQELKLLNAAFGSLSSIRETILAKDGILAKLHQKMQLKAQAEHDAAKLREIVRKQAAKGKETVTTAQCDQEKAIASVNTTIRFSMGLIVGISIGAIAFGILIGLWIYRSIALPMGQLIAASEEVAGGNLAARLESGSRDEVGKVQASMAKMVDSIRQIVARIGAATESLASNSEEMSTTAGVLEDGAEQQALRVEQSAAAMVEMSQTTLDVARNTSEAAGTAEMMKTAALEGKEAMALTVRELRHFAGTFEDTAGKVELLGDQSAQINEIVTLIEDIADQTNLLALNASIEAARAGEQGRGFAVVADSVRQLAERTATATADISQTVKAMQESVKQSVGSMHHERRSVGTILDRINDTMEATDRIVGYVERVTDMVRRIAVAAEQQSSTSGDVSQNMDEISVITRELRGSFSDIRHSSDDLSRLAGELNGMVGWFRV